jgi:hypothetical protein
MNSLVQHKDDDSDRVDPGAVALVAMMIGAVLSLAGLLQQHPVLSSIADVYDATPSLTAGQTLFLGLTLFTGGAGLRAWSARPQTQRHFSRRQNHRHRA